MRHAMVLGSWFVAVVVAGCGTSGVASPAASPLVSAPASPVPSASGAVESPTPSDVGTPLAERLEAEIAVPGGPDWPLAAFGSIWVLAPDLPLHGKGEPHLVRIDPATNEIVATIVLPDRLCQGFTASDDAIWVCAFDALVRIDPATNAITDSVPVNGAAKFYRPAFGGGMVWALGSAAFVGDTVIRLDPATQTTILIPSSGAVGSMTYGLDALWLTMTSDGTVVRMDPVTGETKVVSTGLTSPNEIVVGSDSLWVAVRGSGNDQAMPGDVQLVRIDPDSGATLAELVVGGSPQWGLDLWAGNGQVLARSTYPWLARIAPATNEVVDTVAYDQAIQGPMTVAFGSIWTVNIERDVVYRVRP